MHKTALYTYRAGPCVAATNDACPKLRIGVGVLLGAEQPRCLEDCDAIFSNFKQTYYTNINRKHRKAAAKSVACAKPLMLSTVGRVGAREGYR